MTASPTSSANKVADMIKEINRLSELINGTIIMPVLYRQNFDNFVNRPAYNFLAAEENPDDEILCSEINQFLVPFMKQLNSAIDFNTSINIKNNALRSYLRNVTKDFNIQANFKALQITNFLQMVLGAFEIMQILGTKKAVDFIKEKIQLEFEKNLKNRIWSEIEKQYMKNFIEKISNLKGHSTRLSILHQLLMETTEKIPESRILIFVRSRKTAKLLNDHLNSNLEIRKFWKPKYCVGQAGGGLDGMTWNEDQEPIIESFNQGECKLLVATSVLQEGIDVQICNKVIIFDTMWNLTQFVQSRGRARHQESQFIIIDSPRHKKNYESLIESEKDLINLIGSLPQKNFVSVNQLIFRQVDLIEKTSRVPRLIELCNGKNRKSRFTLQIYLISGKFEDLFSSLKQCKGFMQYEAVDDGYVGVNLFDKFQSFNVLFEINKGKKQVEEIWNILNNIRFILSSKLFECAIYNFKSDSNLTSSNCQFICESIEFGNLCAPNEFYTGSKLKKSKLIIDFQLRAIRILTFINSKLHKLEFQFDAIDHLISFDCMEEHVHVYFPFKQAPIVSIVNQSSNFNEENLKNLDIDYLAWERTCVELTKLTLKMEFSNTDKNYLIEALKNLKGNNLFFTNVKNFDSTYKIENLRRDFIHKNFSTRYFLEVFISQNYYILEGKIDRNFATKLNNLSSLEVEKTLECLSAILKTKRFLNLNNVLEEIIENRSKCSNSTNLYEKNLKISLFRRAIITPSRVILFFPEPNLSNRVTREFGEDNFIRIRFRDEDLRKLNLFSKNSDMKNIYLRIEEFLNQGLTLFNRKYDFLAMSSSQLREHGCWLFNSSHLNPDHVRSWMGDFNNIRCIGKYAARLGQSLSSSIETFESQRFSMIDDITVGDYCFTDGIGKISLIKAEEISREFYARKYPASAFQIRFGGFKGVVAVDPNLKNSELLFRNSMRKFDSGYNRLDVINVADYIPCFLNRQIIVILSSLGIKDSVFDSLQDEMLKFLSNLLIDKLTASLSIMKYYRPIFSDYKHSEKLNYCHEPFFRDLLKTIYKKSLIGLIKKSRIFVQKGRILMGTIDETGKLNHDEVFVQCSKQPGEFYNKNEVIDSKNENIIINKKVVIAKNPCMHPGDIRVLNAVDLPELRHMVDCVVFPSVGSRPITNMCSGSDLDGDLYFVSWEPRIIPEFVEEPMNYSSPKASEKNSKIQIEDVIKFFVNFIEMDQLGRIANAHVAISDHSKLGVKDPLCIKLAEAFSLAVDFPKTGIMAELPGEIKNLKYPDFMEKIGFSYTSEKIIGKLYRKCKKIFINDMFTDRIELNSSFLVNGHEKFVPQAKEIYTKYRAEIERMMNFFNCSHESELFVGIYFNSINSDEAKNFFQVSCSMIKKLWSHMRDLFMDTLNREGKYDKETKIQIASSWYYACYSNEQNKKLRILSFPWILEDILNLIEIKERNNFSFSIVEKFCLSKNNFQLYSRFIEKTNLKKEIESITGLKFLITGSFGLFLFEQKTDLQMVVYGPEVEKKYLNESVAEKLENHFDNIFYHDQLITCTECDDISFNLIESNEILKKFIYLRKTIFSNPELLPVFYFVAHFAREDELFLKLNNYNFKLDDFLIFFLNFLIERNYVNQVSETEVDNELINISKDENLFDCLVEWSKIFDYLDDLQYTNQKEVGEMIINVYQYMSFENKHFNFKKDVKKDENFDEILKSHFYKVFDCVSKTLDVTNVWNSLRKLPEPVFKQTFSFARKKGKSPNLFVKNASLLLFSNYRSNFDLVEFELYKGKRRSFHLSKECYTAKISRTISDFTSECFNKFYHHSIAQFNKAKEMKSDFDFRIQLKFGDSYFTNVPSEFENSSALVFNELMLALKKGYKIFPFCFHQEEKKSCFKIENSDKEDDGDDLLEDDSKDTKNKSQKKKRKKKIVKKANTAFDSNVNYDLNSLNTIFLENEFESKTSHTYIVYLDLKNAENQRKNTYRLKYGSELEFVRIETLPIKWCSIDIRNMTKNTETRDIRFNLISEKILNLERENVDELKVNKAIENGVIKIDNNGNSILNEEFRSCSSVYVRDSKSIKYYGGYEHWKILFDMAKVQLPDNISKEFLKNFRICLSDSKEFSEPDERGHFSIKTNRTELSVASKVDVNSLKSSEINDLVLLCWYLIQIFAKIFS